MDLCFFFAMTPLQWSVTKSNIQVNLNWPDFKTTYSVEATEFINQPPLIRQWSLKDLINHKKFTSPVYFINNHNNVHWLLYGLSIIMWVNKAFLKEHYQYVSEDNIYKKNFIKDLHEGMFMVMLTIKEIEENNLIITIRLPW